MAAGADAVSRPRPVNAVVHLPLVVPPVVTGWLLLVIFGVRGPVGSLLWDWFGIRLVFTTHRGGDRLRRDGVPGDGARHPAVAGGGGSRARGGGAHARRLAGSTGCGASPCRSPRPASWSAASSATRRRLGEFGAVITFAANIPGETQTLPLAIFTALQVPGGEARAATLAMVSFCLAPRRLAAVANGLARGSIAGSGGDDLSAAPPLPGTPPGIAMDMAFEAPSPGVTALFGPSGCGKSTALRTVAGLLRAGLVPGGGAGRGAGGYRRRDLGAARAAARRHGVPGFAAVPASHRSPATCATGCSRAAQGAGRLRRGGGPAGHRPAARAPPARAVGRRDASASPSAARCSRRRGCC
ncbi:MAG: hypothetical protein QM757_20035 [Paludibaculum sp.]